MNVLVVDERFFEADACHHILGQHLIRYVCKNPFVVS
jgi:hypothetical protein